MKPTSKRNAAKAVFWNRGFRTCHYCDLALTLRPGRPNSMTLDHKHPTSRGGYDGPSNYVAACQPCNSAKADMLYCDFMRSRPARRSAA